jgi:hypothetical protein
MTIRVAVIAMLWALAGVSFGGAMETHKEPLPTGRDKRVDTVVAEAVPDDVVVSVAMVARGKIPFDNFRWQVTKDGKAFFVRHSKKPGDWQVPFDRPLPAKPSRTLKPAELTTLQTALEQASFFSHPGYEHPDKTHDGEYFIVRARPRSGAGPLHTVVYENVKSPLIDELYRVTEELE